METATITSQRTYHTRQPIAKTPAAESKNGIKWHMHTMVIPFLVLVYIFNGNHDPKKVHWLNAILALGFFLIGIIFNPDFLMLGTAFFTIALTNIGCLWIVRYFGSSNWSPAVEEILSQLHGSVRYYIEQ